LLPRGEEPAAEITRAACERNTGTPRPGDALSGIRQFLAGPSGRRVSVALLVVALLALAYSVWSNFGEDAVTAASRDRIYICSETGKAFPHKVQLGDSIPVDSPHSGKKTGYPAELCYWTADGGTKPEPTPVLLNQRAGKPGPTFCPDCGRLVVGLNPPPAPGVKPPPKQAEYASSRKEHR
jgi:hypothetical protein